MFFSEQRVNPLRFCHRPILISDRRTLLAEVLRRLRVDSPRPTDDVIDRDLVLVWGEERRIITGADILGRLLRGIVRRRRK